MLLFTVNINSIFFFSYIFIMNSKRWYLYNNLFDQGTMGSKIFDILHVNNKNNNNNNKIG
jgi:hypothetical protein